MSKKTNVSWIKPAEPSFLRKFKNDVGFKEGPTVDTKREELPKFDDDSDDSDREDEKPQVVVLKKGHLSAEEVHKIKIKDSKSEGKPAAEGKIIFKKPEKRSSEKFQGITASSSKKRKQQQQQEQEQEEEEEEEEKEKEKEEKKTTTESQKGKEENEGKKVKNSSLLSFGDDNDDDDDDEEEEEDEEDDDED